MKLPWDGKRLGELLKRYQYVLLVLAVGLGLLLWPSGGDGGETAGEEAAVQTVDWTAQTEALERRLAETLSQIEGVGQAEVVLTLRSSARQILATDQNGEESATVVVSAGSSRQEAVSVQELYPEYRGALVVCDGGGDSQIQLQVLQAVQALTGLNANQISICERTGGSQE